MGLLVAALFFLLFALSLVVTRGKFLSSGYAFGASQALFLILCVAPIFFLGLYFIAYRPLDAGFDTARYVEAYLALEDFFSAREIGAGIYGNTELLWWPFQSLLPDWLGARGWLVINYFLVFLMVFLAYVPLAKKYSISPLVFSLVFLTYFFVYSGNAMRQAISLPFALISFCSLFDKKYFRFIFCALVAIGFHWSAIFFLFAPLMTLRFFNNRWVFLIIPIVLFALSMVFSEFAKTFVDVVGLPELRVKYELYFESGRISHVGIVWTKLNFWLCVGVSVVFLLSCKPDGKNVLHAYVSFILGLILFGVSIPDFSERFFPAVFIVFPLMLALIYRSFKFPGVLTEGAVYLTFWLLGFLVVANRSAQETLGYNFSGFFEGL